MVSKNFYESLELIANDRGLDIDKILKVVETAMQVACKNSDCPYKGTITLESDYEKKKVKFYNNLYVVSEVDPEGPRGQITLEEAKEIKAKVRVGSTIKTEVKLDTFKRKAASLFKQNLLNGLKGLEREEAYEYFKDKQNEIVTGKVIAVNDRFVTFNLKPGVDATMAIKDCMKNETFNIGEDKKIYVVSVEATEKGPKINLCRNNRDMVKKLFEMNIPEIANGTIEIMGVARDAGLRSKVGVVSMDPNVDAKGACVGPQGSRIKSINNALDGEKIDIFLWKNDPVDLIAEALTPAKVLAVTIDEKEKKAVVTVQDDQYSLAIGKNGQNSRLAAIATGWKIDIHKLSEATESGLSFQFNVFK